MTSAVFLVLFGGFVKSVVRIPGFVALNEFSSNFTTNLKDEFFVELRIKTVGSNFLGDDLISMNGYGLIILSKSMEKTESPPQLEVMVDFQNLKIRNEFLVVGNNISVPPGKDFVDMKTPIYPFSSIHQKTSPLFSTNFFKAVERNHAIILTYQNSTSRDKSSPTYSGIIKNLAFGQKRNGFTASGMPKFTTKPRPQVTTELLRQLRPFVIDVVVTGPTSSASRIPVFEEIFPEANAPSDGSYILLDSSTSSEYSSSKCGINQKAFKFDNWYMCERSEFHENIS